MMALSNKYLSRAMKKAKKEWHGTEGDSGFGNCMQTALG